MSVPYICRASTMPSENTFKSHIELINAYLTAFEAIIKLDAPPAIKTTLETLSVSVSDLHNYVPFFEKHPLFRETVCTVYTTLEDYFSKNPTVEKPFSFRRVAGMYGGTQNLTQAERHGMVFLVISLHNFTILTFIFSF